MSIYTGSGDKGSTSLLSGERVFKVDSMVEAYGTLDELTAQLGICRALIKSQKISAPFADFILNIQRQLFRAGMQLSSLPEYWNKLSDPITGEDVSDLENTMDDMEQAFGMPSFFVSPGQTLTGASLHLARTVCRRAERRTLTAAGDTPGYEIILQYLNRLSDLLFSISWAVETRILIKEELSHGNNPIH